MPSRLIFRFLHMATMGADFAQAYVMKKLNKERMKRTEEKMGTGAEQQELNKSCFRMMMKKKKIHPNGSAPPKRSDRSLAQIQ
ncbi:hypothetical protein MUK42_25226 [Musa troglodytarum]|uniref:Uncharacterized protein n=1 Tax=Musa troglodytarum TaxID=320322 RepID=A0A9E7LA26_9LILI|nr:hypothetical protein MUK42_25226 [Musa troglodytarum]